MRPSFRPFRSRFAGSSARSSGASIGRLTILSMLVAAGILMQLIESFFPIVVVIPGYRLGLANIAGLYALYAWGPKEMVIVTALRVFIASLAMGTLFSIPFWLSVSGCTLSCIVMSLARRSNLFSIYGVSTAGAASHTLGQIAAICIIYQQYFMQMFLPVLTALSVVSGLCIAWLTRILLERTGFLRYGARKNQVK